VVFAEKNDKFSGLDFRFVDIDAFGLANANNLVKHLVKIWDKYVNSEYLYKHSHGRNSAI
jgi:hypothetical protein